MPHPPPATASQVPPLQKQIPPFIQKLLDIIKAPDHYNLIRWSNSGDSLLVLDSDRFTNDILDRYFKHRNWSTFVRQLNNYGFKKIQNLKQGALREVAGERSWEYAHPYFRRERPDLVCFIERQKKQDGTTQTTAQTVTLEDDEVDTTTREPLDLVPSRDAFSYGDDHAHTPSTATLTNAQMIKVISTLKHDQTIISAELATLKQAFNAFCQEFTSLHNKHHDILMKILKFLAEVFGNHTVHNNSSQQHSQGDMSQSDMPKAVVAVRPYRGRLMIEGSSAPGAQDQELSRRFEAGSINTCEKPMQPHVRSPGENPAITHINGITTTQDPCTAEVNDTPPQARMRPEYDGRDHQTTTKDTSTTSSHTPTTVTGPSSNLAIEDDAVVTNNVQPTTTTTTPSEEDHYQELLTSNFAEQFVQSWLSGPQNMDGVPGVNDLLSGLDPSFNSTTFIPSTSSPVSVDMFGPSFDASTSPNTTAHFTPVLPTSFTTSKVTASPTPPPPISDTDAALFGGFSSCDINAPLQSSTQGPPGGPALDFENFLNTGLGIWPNSMNTASCMGMDPDISFGGDPGCTDNSNEIPVVNSGLGGSKRKVEWMTGESFDSGGTESKRRRAD